MRRRLIPFLALAALAAAPHPLQDPELLGFTPAGAAEQRALEARYDGGLSADTLRAWMRELTDKPFYVGSEGARENARSIRDTITWEMWTALNKFYLMTRNAAQVGIAREDLRTLYDEVIRGAHLFNGVTEATLSRDEPWHFYSLGRMLERADKTSRILDVKYHVLLPEYENVGGLLDYYHWRAILRSVSALGVA